MARLSLLGTSQGEVRRVAFVTPRHAIARARVWSARRARARRGEADGEAHGPLGGRVEGDRSAMGLRGELAEVEADPDVDGGGRTRAALEFAEDPLAILGRDGGPGVRDAELRGV